MRLRALEHRASSRLGVPVKLALSQRRLQLDELSPAERGKFAECRCVPRQNDWLSGRAALKELLPALGRGTDTAMLSFPEPGLSLTHSGQIAIAAGTARHGYGCRVGIDYERLRTVNGGVAHWFLDTREIDWLRGEAELRWSDHIVRLWTVKEAAFKSTPDNARMSLRDIAIAEPGALVTRAMVRQRMVRVFTQPFDSGYVTLAVSRELL